MFSFFGLFDSPKKTSSEQESMSNRSSRSSEKCKLPRLSLPNDFWDAYESDYSDSGAESLCEYEKDGYHPVHVGEVLDGLMKKLGFGAFSTVWFCHDYTNNKFVAIKVQKSGKNYYSAAEDEIEILDLIAKNWQKKEWRDTTKEKGVNSVHCLSMLDHFEFKGPHGNHICMVFEIMGLNLMKVMKLYKWEGIPVPLVRILAKQILIGIDYLHRLCNVIHTDIKPENVICSPTTQQLMNHYESVPSQFKSHITGKINAKMFDCNKQVNPRVLTCQDINSRDRFKGNNNSKTLQFKHEQKIESSDEEDNEESNDILTEKVQVKVCDFGNGCWINKHFTSSIQTRQYRSPEVILGIEYDETCDLWSFACMIFELITGDYLFNPKASDTYSRSEDHIALIHELIGAPELKWLQKAKKFRKFYTTHGRMKKITKHKIWGLENVLKDKYCFKPIEAKKLADFLQMALQWKNEDRASAQEMLKHEWLTMPADYDCRVDTKESDEKESNENESNKNESDNEESDCEYSDDWQTLGSESDSENSEFEMLDYP